MPKIDLFRQVYIAITVLALILPCQLAIANQESPGTLKISRIASGTIASDEIILELLQRRDQLERLIAVSSLWGHAEYSRLSVGELPKSVEGRVGDSIESLLMLRPDLVVLASYNRVEFLEQLRQSGVKLLVQENFRSIRDIKDNILEIGKALDTESSSKALVSEMKQEFATLKKSPLRHVSGRRLRYLNYSKFHNFYGEDTIFHSIVEELDGVNLVAESGLKGWNQISDEVLVTFQPDIIIAAARNKPDEKSIRRHMATTSWRHLKAVQDDRIIFVNTFDLQSVSHHIVNAVKQIHAGVMNLEISSPPERIRKGSDGS